MRLQLSTAKTFQPVPAHEGAELEVIEVDAAKLTGETSKNKGYPCPKIVFSLVGGPHNGRRVNRSYFLKFEGETAVGFAGAFMDLLACCGVDPDTSFDAPTMEEGASPQDSMEGKLAAMATELIGKRLKADIIVTDGKQKKRLEDGTVVVVDSPYGPSNDLKNMTNLDGTPARQCRTGRAQDVKERPVTQKKPASKKGKK